MHERKLRTVYRGEDSVEEIVACVNALIGEYAMIKVLTCPEPDDPQGVRMICARTYEVPLLYIENRTPQQVRIAKIHIYTFTDGEKVSPEYVETKLAHLVARAFAKRWACNGRVLVIETDHRTAAQYHKTVVLL